MKTNYVNYFERVLHKKSQNIDLKQAKKDIINDIDNCLFSQCQRIDVVIVVLQQWKTKVTQLMPESLFIEHFSDQFVITPIDKTNSSFAFVFKQYYITMLLKKCGICGSEQIKSTQKKSQENICKLNFSRRSRSY